ncbi:MAG: hypothetical protein WBG73_08165 [Coleofasciculaceae cyanobacterium]
MAPSDDFKAQLKAGNINEALSLALNGAVDLKITTWVTTGDKQTLSQPGHRLRTRINTIEGKVDNEIGDQFISNGPYRELRQFHLEQVSQGSEIIHSNLKSLQTLFDVVIAMQSAQRRIASLPSFPGSFVLEPSSDQQLLPTAPAQTDASLLTEPSEDVEDLAAVPDSLSEDVEELAAVPDSLSEVATPVPQIEVPATVSGVPAATPPEVLIEEDEDEEDDWDDSVLDLLESLPVGPPELEALDDSEEEDWRNFIEEDDAPDPELDSPSTEDWGILTAADFEPPTETNLESPKLPEDLGELIKEEPLTSNLATQDSEKLSFEDLPSPTETPVVIPETLIPEEEDWGDLIEDEMPVLANKPVPSLESLNLEEDEEWDDWVVESEPLQDSSISRLESLDVADDDDWDDFEEDADPFAAAPTNSELNEDADWDNFSVDELEPYSGLLDLDTNVGAGFDLSGSFEDLNVAKPQDKDYLERPQQQFSKPDDQNANDLMAVFFGDELEPADAEAAPDQNTDKTEEELFADMQFEEFLANGNSASEESEAKAKADLEAPPASAEIILPPPPDASHLPNQNN